MKRKRSPSFPHLKPDLYAHRMPNWLLQAFALLGGLAARTEAEADYGPIYPSRVVGWSNLAIC